jgi:hypothetical protein
MGYVTRLASSTHAAPLTEGQELIGGRVRDLIYRQRGQAMFPTGPDLAGVAAGWRTPPRLTPRPRAGRLWFSSLKPGRETTVPRHEHTTTRAQAPTSRQRRSRP